MSKRASPDDVAFVPPADDTDEASRIRRLPSELQRTGARRCVRATFRKGRSEQPSPVEDLTQETVPCPPPADAIAGRLDLDRTLRFARLVRETLGAHDENVRLLDLAILRRDAALLTSILTHLSRLQAAAGADADGSHIDSIAEAEDRTSVRSTILPPAPAVVTPLPQLKKR